MRERVESEGQRDEGNRQWVRVSHGSRSLRASITTTSCLLLSVKHGHEPLGTQQLKLENVQEWRVIPLPNPWCNASSRWCLCSPGLFPTLSHCSHLPPLRSVAVACRCVQERAKELEDAAAQRMVLEEDTVRLSLQCGRMER